jgi:hypothetical protein
VAGIEAGFGAAGSGFTSTSRGCSTGFFTGTGFGFGAGAFGSGASLSWGWAVVVGASWISRPAPAVAV